MNIDLKKYNNKSKPNIEDDGTSWEHMVGMIAKVSLTTERSISNTWLVHTRF